MKKITCVLRQHHELILLFLVEQHWWHQHEYESAIRLLSSDTHRPDPDKPECDR